MLQRNTERVRRNPGEDRDIRVSKGCFPCRGQPPCTRVLPQPLRRPDALPRRSGPPGRSDARASLAAPSGLPLPLRLPAWRRWDHCSGEDHGRPDGAASYPPLMGDHRGRLRRQGFLGPSVRFAAQVWRSLRTERRRSAVWRSPPRAFRRLPCIGFIPIRVLLSLPCPSVLRHLRSEQVDGLHIQHHATDLALDLRPGGVQRRSQRGVGGGLEEEVPAVPVVHP